MKSLQEIFDIVSTHLLKQNRQAREYQAKPDNYFGGVCRYRSPEGLKCAVGCLINDNQYVETMEAAGSLINFNKLQPEGKGDDYDYYAPSNRDRAADLVLAVLTTNGIDMQADSIRALLFRLQSLHDQEEPKRWRARLQVLATEFKLKFNHAEV